MQTSEIALCAALMAVIVIVCIATQKPEPVAILIAVPESVGGHPTEFEHVRTRSDELHPRDHTVLKSGCPIMGRVSSIDSQEFEAYSN